MEAESHSPEPKMNDLSNDVLAEIFLRLKDRKHVSLVCRKWYELDRVLTRELRVGQGQIPLDRVLAALTSRFFNLTKVEISHMGWASDMGKQVDDDGLRSLSRGCVNLTDLSLKYCSYVTDVGVASIALCPRLTAVRLTFTPCVSGRGLLSLVSGCHSLRLLHVDQLVSVRVVEWLEFLGTHRQIESLGIWNCKGVGEAELVKLGRRGWRNLREFFYEVEVVHRPSGDYFGHNGRSAYQLRGWRFAGPEGMEYCPNLEVLSLTSCLSMSTTGLLWILWQCKSLRSVRIDTCVGLQDEDISLFAKNNPQISSLNLKIACHLPTPNLTNVSLLEIAQHCRSLETLVIACTIGNFIPVFLETGIMAIVESCKGLRSLAIHHVPLILKSTMSAIEQSTSLEAIEFIDCDLSDDMMRVIGSNLTRLSLIDCPNLTDECLSEFRVSQGTSSLVFLKIEGCPKIRQEAARDATKVLIYKNV